MKILCTPSVVSPAFGAALVLALPAWAQDAPTTVEQLTITAERDYAPPVTETAMRTQTPLLLTPQSVQVVPRAVLNDQKALVLSDAIRNVAGVGMDFGFNGPTQPLLVLRGFSASSMTAAGTMSGSSSYYLNGSKVAGLPVNMANVEAVEVVKGPSTVLYGRAEPGGLVNVVSRPFSADSRLALEQTLGSYSLSRTTLDGGGPINAGRTLLAKASASYFTTHSERDFVEDRLGALSAGLAFVPSPDTSVSITLDYVDQKYRTDYGVPADGDRPAKLPRSRQFNDAPELSSTRSLSTLIEARHRFGDDWEVRAKGVVIRADTREVDITPYRFDYGLNPPETCDGAGTDLCRYYFYARPKGRYELNQVSVDVLGRVAAGGWTHALLFGLDAYEAEKSGVTYLQQVSSVSVANPVLGNTPRLDPSLATPDDRLDRNRWVSLYIQDQIDFGQGLHGVIAVRHDWTSAIYATRGTAPNKVAFTTPRVGVVWEFRPGQTVYAQYQEALSANNGRDPLSGAPLAPEKSRQTEVGYKLVTAQGRMIATLAAYDLVKRNRADYSLFPIVTTLGEARSRGVELDVIGQVTSKLALIGSYAYTDSRVTDDGPYAGKRLANTPYNAASLWARYTIDPRWSVGGGVFYQDGRLGDVGGTFQLPAYARVDVMAAYSFRAFGQGASLQLNVNNLFDKRYYTGSHQFVSDWIAPGAPRTVLATLRVEY